MNFLAGDVDGLIKEALEKTTDQIRTADRVVFLLQEGRELSIKAAHEGRPIRSLPAEKMSRAILRRVRRTGRTLFLSDALVDSGLGTRESIQEIGQRSVICAPLKAKGKVVGLMYADTVSLIAAFTPAHLRWVNQMMDSLNERLDPLIVHHVDTTIEDKSETLEDDGELIIAPIVAKANPLADALAGKVDEEINRFVYAEPKPIPFQRQTKNASKPKAVSPAQTRLSLQELSTFYRGFASMLMAGITVHRALDVLAEQDTPSAPIAKLLHDQVVSGRRLSSSMKLFPKVFDSVHCNLIRIGEETGSLDTLSASLADHVEERMVLKGKIINALTYPVIVMTICLLGCLLAPPLFLNDFFETLSSANAKLPWITQMVLTLSNLLWSPWLWLSVALAAVAGVAGWKKFRANRDWVVAAEKQCLKVPVLGQARQAFFLLDFVQTLALQIDAGMRLDKSLLLSAQVTDSPHYQDKARWIVEQIIDGDSLSFSFHRSGIFPSIVVEFVALGEETGKMSESFRFVGALLKERAEHALEMAEALMEPLSIALVGILVGIVALACMLPLVRMFDAFA